MNYLHCPKCLFTKNLVSGAVKEVIKDHLCKTVNSKIA